MSILDDSLNVLPRKDTSINFVQPMISHHNIGYLILPKVHKVNFAKLDEGNIVNDKPMNVDNITPEMLNNIGNSKELKKIANSIGIYDTKGGNQELKRKILERMELIKQYHTL